MIIDFHAHYLAREHMQMHVRTADGRFVGASTCIQGKNIILEANGNPLGNSWDCFLITGAMGCIGAWVIRNLVREGASVVAFDLARDPRRLKLIMKPDELAQVTFVRGDITELAELEQVLEMHAITHIIHLAALQMPFVRANPSLGAQVNVVGTVNVFEAAARRRERGV